jgi:conserved oligomeric Golgi complex subunit 7
LFDFTLQDLKAFSGDTFDVKDWVNKTFKSSEAQKQNKEQYASSLVMKLQLLIAKLNASLEEQSEAVCQNLPRVVRDTESMQQEALLLQAKMEAVQEEIDKVNRETGSSMGTLVQMDLFKERIQATRRALKEADNWTTLTSEIEDAIDNNDLSLISEKLSGIQSSLKILSHVPDYDDRVIHFQVEVLFF